MLPISSFEAPICATGDEKAKAFLTLVWITAETPSHKKGFFPPGQYALVPA